MKIIVEMIHLIEKIIIMFTSIFFIINFYNTLYSRNYISLYLIFLTVFYYIKLLIKSAKVKNIIDEIKGICRECNSIEYYGSKHCYICDCCYYNRDHHCSFLGKCITQNNYKDFISFVLSMNLYFFFSVCFRNYFYELKIINTYLCISLTIYLLFLIVKERNVKNNKDYEKIKFNTLEDVKRIYYIFVERIMGLSKENIILYFLPFFERRVETYDFEVDNMDLAKIKI